MKNHNPVIVALDVPSAEEALRIARDLATTVGGFKIGLNLLMGPGPATIAALASLDLPLFVDAKLHDIPNTVAAAAFQLGRLGARWISVHAQGGLGMCQAAVEGLAAGAATGRAGVLAVTVLTSSSAAELAAVGVASGPGKQTARLAKIAVKSGCEGVVCPVRELGVVGEVGPDLIRVTPGIRPAGAAADDQVHVATPEEAVSKGADYIVVGRPIVDAPDPVTAASEIARSSGAAARPDRLLKFGRARGQEDSDGTTSVDR